MLTEALRLIERPVDRALVTINETLRSVTHETWQYTSQITNGSSVFLLGFLYRPSVDNYLKERHRISEHIPVQSPIHGVSPFAPIVNRKKETLEKQEKTRLLSPEVSPLFKGQKKKFRKRALNSSTQTQPLPSKLKMHIKRSLSEPDLGATNGWQDIQDKLPDDININGESPSGLFEDLRLLQLTIINFIITQLRWIWHSVISFVNGYNLFSVHTLLAPFYILQWIFMYIFVFFQLGKRCFYTISQILFHPEDYLSNQGIDTRTKEQIVKDSGYPYELHTVTTEDGYIITLERLPNPSSRNVIYFQHGLLDSGFTWLASGNSASLAMAAYDKGYDVFLGNFRGNAPTSHVNRNISPAKYWNFTINDHAFKDMPAFVKHIHNVKRRELQIPAREIHFRDHFELTCVGHSMGGMAALMYMIECGKDDRWHGFTRAVLLSPAGIHKDTPPSARYGVLLVDLVVRCCPFIHYLGFPSNFLRVVSAKVMEDVKSTSPTRNLFTYIASTFVGGSIEDHSLNRVNVVRWVFTGTPVTVFRHFRQLIWSKQFCAFDYGKKRNEREYGSPTPPCYIDHYDKIDIPVYYMMGLIDNMIRPANVVAHFNAHAKHHPEKAFLRAFANAGHVEFTWGVNEEMTNVILGCIQNEDSRAASVRLHTIHRQKNE